MRKTKDTSILNFFIETSPKIRVSIKLNFFLLIVFAILFCCNAKKITAGTTQSQNLILDKEKLVSQKKKSKLISQDVNQIMRETTVLIKKNRIVGSGVLVAAEGKKHYVLTAAHVLKHGSGYRIILENGEKYNAFIVIKKIPGLDLALLSFESINDYPIATLLNSSISSNPMNANFNAKASYIYNLRDSKSKNTPIISCGLLFGEPFASIIRQSTIYENDGYDLVYTNVTKQGLSGSPIFNDRGQVIGIHGRVEGDNLSNISSLSIGFSLGIPIQYFIKVINQTSLNLSLVTEKENIDTTYRSFFDGFENSTCSNSINPPGSTATAIEWGNYANSMLRSFQLQEALNAYNKALNNNYNGELYHFWYGRGITLILMGRINEAASNFNRALSLVDGMLIGREDSQHLIKTAKVLLLRFKAILEDNILNRIKIYRKALAIDQNNFQVWLSIAQALESLGRYSEALEAYNETLHIYPEFTESRLYKSIIYIKINKYNLAIEELSRAIKIDPRDPQLYALRSIVYEKIGNNEKSKEDREIIRQLVGQLGTRYVDHIIRTTRLLYASNTNPEDSLEHTIETTEVLVEGMRLNGVDILPFEFDISEVFGEVASSIRSFDNQSPNMDDISSDYFNRFLNNFIGSIVGAIENNSELNIEPEISDKILEIVKLQQEILNLNELENFDYKYSEFMNILGSFNTNENIVVFSEFYSTIKLNFLSAIYIKQLLKKNESPTIKINELKRRIANEVNHMITQKQNLSSTAIAYAFQSGFREELNNDERAVSDLTRARNLLQDVDSVLYFYRGLGFMVAGNFELAQQSIETSISLDTGSEKSQEFFDFSFFNHYELRVIIDNILYGKPN
ncbi:tetratricopeptide repeat-containing serine protease family protein [Geitlerinema sp. PCC 9228]|uniref:tetratricopeptide repeat-containing S1 family peptidase n=1 Tax=Geitlerinema sp. PCC 9228 TaxID=111611 RepID=UPI0008F9A2C3|nr:tetratricopeptide repeat-containing serine protease family protein [Geitlerinema sp. PCC 9228]